MAEQYWPIYEIRFTKPQMWFLIRHLGELKEGRYPEKPGASNGYGIELPPGLSERVYREPAQNRVLDLVAEVEDRLGLVMDYISGWHRPTKKVRRNLASKEQRT